MKDMSAQDCPKETRYRTKIDARTYNHGKLIKNVKSVICYDSLMNELSATDEISGSEKWITLEDTKMRFVQVLLDEKGDSVTKVIYVNDSSGKRIANYQLYNKDTVVWQKRYYNRFGYDSLLLYAVENEISKLNRVYKENFTYDGPKFIFKVQMKWEYINDTILSKTISYSEEDDDSTIIENINNNGVIFQYETNAGKRTLISKTEKISELKTKVTYYVEGGGVNYGISIFHKKNGYRMTENDKKGRILKMETFFSNGELINSVKFTYE